MIRILEITGSLRMGGLETVAMNCMRYANREKCQFDFLVFGDEIGEFEDEAVEKGCRIIRVTSPNKDRRGYYRNIVKAIQTYGPYDVVHSHVFFSSGIVMKAAYRCGVPVRIAHAHSVNRKSDNTLKKRIFHVFMRLCFNLYATKLCACSQQAGEYVFRRKLFSRIGLVMPNSITPERFKYSEYDRNRVRKELGINSSQIVIGQVGNLTSAKNQLFLLELFSKYLEQYKVAKLLIIGEGEMRQKIEARIKELGISDSVILTGTMINIGPLLSAMDVYVCTSTNEGFGITLLEAATNGLQVVVERNVIVHELHELINPKLVEGFSCIDLWVNAIAEVGDLPRNTIMYDVIANSKFSKSSMSDSINRLYGI